KLAAKYTLLPPCRASRIVCHVVGRVVGVVLMLVMGTRYLDLARLAPRYVKHAAMDASGADLLAHPMWSTDLAQLMWLCDINPLCLGFNTNGWLKAGVSRLVPSSAVDLYVKSSSGL